MLLRACAERANARVTTVTCITSVSMNHSAAARSLTDLWSGRRAHSRAFGPTKRDAIAMLQRHLRHPHCRPVSSPVDHAVCGLQVFQLFTR